MLRNLNQRSSGRRICGTPHVGIRGALIPSSGENGPSVIYNDLSLPAENNDEFRFRLTVWPASGSLFMYEDGSFKYIPAADGTVTATGVLMRNGVDVGPETITLQSGAVGVTINAAVGSASAAGAPASVALNRTVSCEVGSAAAAGQSATILQGQTINCTVGDAVAYGSLAIVGSDRVIACGIGGATAGGAPAAVMQGQTITCLAGDANASGLPATVESIPQGGGTTVTISCGVGEALASGLSAGIALNRSIACAVGSAVASGALAIVLNQTTNYTRAPAGRGYSPQRDERQSRPTSGAQSRPAAIQRNNR